MRHRGQGVTSTKYSSWANAASHHHMRDTSEGHGESPDRWGLADRKVLQGSRPNWIMRYLFFLSKDGDALAYLFEETWNKCNFFFTHWMARKSLLRRTQCNTLRAGLCIMLQNVALPNLLPSWCKLEPGGNVQIKPTNQLTPAWFIPSLFCSFSLLSLPLLSELLCTAFCWCWKQHLSCVSEPRFKCQQQMSVFLMTSFHSS